MKNLMRMAVVLTASLTCMSSASAQPFVIAGWDTWDSAIAPSSTVTAADITASATASAVGGTANWTILDSGTDPGRGSSIDTTWGTFDGNGSAASDVTDMGTANMTATTGKTDAEVTFTISNGGTVDVDLDAFHMDVVAFRPNAPRTYSLNVLSGDITNGVVFMSDGAPLSDNSTNDITQLGGGLGTDHDVHDDIDLDLSGLADNTLAAGESVVFQIAFTNGTGAGGGHHLFLDNVAFSSGFVVQTAVPGDFNDDGNIDALDIDAYIGNLDVAAEGELARLDLNGDSQVTAADHEVLVTQLVSAGGLDGTVFGDANLDGTVNVLGDAAILVNNLGSTTAGWATGDFNADGQVNVLGDAAILVNNLGQSNAPGAAVATSAVPEPSSLMLLLAVTAGAVTRRKR